jgi:WXG100 family type VII secretion target
MAAPKVRSDYESLARIATVFRQEADKSRQMLQNVRSKMDVLRNGHWIGKGADVFYREMDSAVLPALGKLVTALESAAETTTRISQIMRQAEQDAAALFRLGGARSLADLKSQIAKTVEGWGTDEAALMSLINGATQAERDAIWKDAALMAKIKDDLSPDEYLDVLTALRVFEPGTTAEDSKKHTKAADADAYIQDQLKDYLGNAVKDGRKISGSVAVVGDSDWDVAGIAHYGESVWNSGKRDDINGFVDSKGRVWIHKDRGNAGTMIHEGVHKYATDDVLNLSQPLNEGVTEFFARKVAQGADPSISRSNYQGNYDLTAALVDKVGEATVAKAYFDGDVAGLKDAFIKIGGGKTEADWSKFVDYTKKGKWADAESMLD